jgi:F-type H+-transporting ATPase subunit c
MGLAVFGLGLGIGLLVIGAAYGIGKLAAAAVEGIARQPEAAGNIRGAAIVLAALIEGFTFFALIVVFLVGNKVDKANWVEGNAGHAALEVRSDEAKVANTK